MAKHCKKCIKISDEFFYCLACLSDDFFHDIKCERCRSCATLSIMIHMYAKLDPETRQSLLEVLGELIDKIGDERFEDNLDFAMYITQGGEEKDD